MTALLWHRLPVVALVLVTAGAQAQVMTDSATVKDNRFLRTSFERNVNTFIWDLHGRYGIVRDGWSVSASDRFLRSLIQTDRSSVKDDQTFRLNVERQLVPSLAAFSSFHSFLFSDTRSLGLTDLTSNKLYGGFRWTPMDLVSIAPFAGLTREKQQGITDRGLLIGGESSLPHVAFDGYALAGNLFLMHEYLGQRREHEQRASAVVDAGFGAGRNSATLSYRKLRRDFYLPFDSSLLRAVGVGNPVESRDEEGLSVSNTLRYDASSFISISAQIDASQRDIVKSRKHRDPASVTPFFDTNIEEFRFNASGSVQYHNAAGTTAEARIEWSERDETHGIVSFAGVNPVAFSRQERLEEQKNNNIAQSQLLVSLTHPLSSKDTISFRGTTVKLTYDTPSALNFDDRDELFLTGGMRLVRRFSPSFVGEIIGEVNVRHTVYVFAARSANNTWNRLFRLAPSTRFRIGSWLTMRATGEVLANYTVYDFEQLNPSLQSFSLRQMTLTDTLSIRISDNASITMQLQVRRYERGQLRWEAFTVRPLALFDETSLFLGIQGSVAWCQATAGMRLFHQSRYSYPANTKRFESDLQNLGPVARFEFYLPFGASVLADGWYQVTSGTGIEPRATPNLMISMVWTL